MEFMEHIYVINPDYLIRDDDTRYLLYSYGTLLNDSDNIRTFLHPMQAQLFSYFGQEPRTLDENIALIAKDYGYSEEDVEEMISPFVGNEKRRVLKYGERKSIIPRNFIIPLSESKREYKPLFSGEIKIDNEKEVDLQSIRLNKAPYTLTLMLTNNCATHCCYCYADTTTKVKRYVPIERLASIIAEARKLQLHNINIIGGEVFLYKDWDVILKEIIGNGFMPDLISTKIPITEELVKRLKDTGYTNVIQLSIDTFDSCAARQTLHAPEGYTDKVKEGLELLEKYEIPYQVGTVLTKWTANRENLKELFKFFVGKKYFKQWEIRQAMYSLGKDMANFKEISAETAIVKELAEMVKNEMEPTCTFKIAFEANMEEEKFRVAKDGCRSFKHGQCSAMNTHLFVLPDGKVTICEQLYWNPDFIVGDINESTLEEIWHSPRMMELVNLERKHIKEESACKACDFFTMCFKTDRNRCWADIIKAYGAENWDFPDPYCAYAPELKNDIYGQ